MASENFRVYIYMGIWWGYSGNIYIFNLNTYIYLSIYRFIYLWSHTTTYIQLNCTWKHGCVQDKYCSVMFIFVISKMSVTDSDLHISLSSRTMVSGAKRRTNSDPHIVLQFCKPYEWPPKMPPSCPKNSQVPTGKTADLSSSKWH
jgi:hypothetical protein